ncbi:MAG: hypothetical protein PHP98_01630 [Kiritimatiellae bacterium]|nr:hypothetical protein [Kiritimatiellia bacterium]
MCFTRKPPSATIFVCKYNDKTTMAYESIYREGAGMMRKDHEPPIATARWGWRYHHTGIPTNQIRSGERYLPRYKMHVSGFRKSPYGIEWMRFEADSPISELVRTVPHLAFEVDDIEEALKGKKVLSFPGSPSAGVRTAMIVDNGCPIELIEFKIN